MDTIVVLFTRDLRVADNPALAAACREADRVVPLFVLDDRIVEGPFGAPTGCASCSAASRT
jgi:deoxyribodipyrimidine photo-lyase